MGASPDGILFYGIALVDEGEDTWNPWIPKYGTPEYDAMDPEELDALYEKYEDKDEITIAEYVAVKDGFKDPWDDYPMHLSNDEQTAWEAENPDWNRRYKSWRKTIDDYEKSMPVEMVYGGDAFSGYTQYHLALKGTHVYAYGYGVKAIDLKTLWEQSQTSLALRAIEFCDKYELGDFREAKWYLTSSYG